MKHPQQRRDGQTLSEEGRLAVLANSPKGRQLAAHPPQAQCRTKRHILPLLKHNTNYNMQKKGRWLPSISKQTIQMQLVPGTPHATTPGSWSTTTIRKQAQKTNQLQTNKFKQAINKSRNVKQQPKQTQ
jgi:hypothetical protein